MRVIWLNGTVGSGKTAVGRALAGMLPDAAFVDGDDHAGPHLPKQRRWRFAMTALLALIARSGRRHALVVAYPLTAADHARLWATCGRGRHPLTVVTLATPLTLVVRGRGTRRLEVAEIARARAMWSEGYARRPFAILTLPNTQPSPTSTACRIARLLRFGACQRTGRPRPAGGPRPSRATLHHDPGVSRTGAG